MPSIQTDYPARPSHITFSNRAEWPTPQLCQLLKQVAEELGRRSKAKKTESGGNTNEELLTLEERLKREARRYQQSTGTIRD